MSRSVVLLGALLGAGCATYRPASIDAVPTGARVRVSLTADATAALAPALGNAVTGVEGAWSGVRGDSLAVRVDRLLTAPGVAIDWTATNVSIARGGVRSIERSMRAPGRTALLVGGVAAAAVVAIDVVRRGGGAKGDPAGGGPVGF